MAAVLGRSIWEGLGLDVQLHNISIMVDVLGFCNDYPAIPADIQTHIYESANL